MAATALGTSVTMLTTSALQGAEGGLAGMESHPDEAFAVEASGEEDLIEEEDEEDEEVPSPAKKPRVELERAVSDPGTFKPHRRGKKVSARKHRKVPSKRQAAPFNTTQFIMNDHGDTIQYLDEKFGVTGNSENNPSDGDPVRRRISRARESSFSLDSDDDFFYSSPDDEEEFLSREFLKDYDSARSDRLVAMGKGELINEYLQMEARIDALEKRLQRSSKRKEREAAPSSTDPDTTERIGVFQREIRALEAENAALREETRALREQRQSGAEVNAENANGRAVDDAEAVVSSSSSDDEGSSSDSGSSSDGESDEEENNADVTADDVEVRLEHGDNNPAGDTGYESQREEEEEGNGPDVTSSTASL